MTVLMAIIMEAGHVYQKAIGFIKDSTKKILLFIRATSNGEDILDSTYVK
jgi:hypothetical protein